VWGILLQEALETCDADEQEEEGRLLLVEAEGGAGLFTALAAAVNGVGNGALQAQA
jgi:hypothetical protein